MHTTRNPLNTMPQNPVVDQRCTAGRPRRRKLFTEYRPAQAPEGREVAV
jgi:hypothetical protein